MASTISHRQYTDCPQIVSNQKWVIRCPSARGRRLRRHRRPSTSLQPSSLQLPPTSSIIAIALHLPPSLVPRSPPPWAPTGGSLTYGAASKPLLPNHATSLLNQRVSARIVSHLTSIHQQHADHHYQISGDGRACSLLASPLVCTICQASLLSPTCTSKTTLPSAHLLGRSIIYFSLQPVMMRRV